MKTAALLAVFWLWQVVAQVFFKYGSEGSVSRWWTGFALGNLFGASSIWFLMKLYRQMSPNLALAIACGGAFVAIQLTLSAVFDSRPTPVQWTGLALVAAGMALASLGAPVKA